MKDLFKLLNSIKVSLIANRLSVSYKVYNIRLCSELLRVLYLEGYILNYIFDKKTNVVYITHNYYKHRPTLQVIKAYNKSSFPLYIKYRDLAAIHKFGIEVLILSTSKGIMPHYEALKQKLGGRAICYLR